MRTLASQMADAKGETLSVTIGATPSSPISVADGHVRTATFTASGRTITFHGFLRAYVESVDEGASDDAQKRLPQLSQGQDLDPREVKANGHDTRPPARYTEPSLVAKLEELEIGRPSTYASIIRTITSRDLAGLRRHQAARGTLLQPRRLPVHRRHGGDPRPDCARQR